MAREGGPDAVVLREATRRVGVAPSAAYRHFADRRALLDAVCSAAQAALAVAIEKELAELVDEGKPADLARARLRGVGTGYLRFAQAEPGLFRTAFSASDNLRSAGWRIITSHEPTIGPCYSPNTIGGFTTTASRSTMPTGIARKADVRPQRFSRRLEATLPGREVSPGRSISARHTRTLDGLLGYLALQRFRLYAEEELAGHQVAVRVQEDSLTVEYGGEALSRYEVECDSAVGANSVGRLRKVKGHTLFENSVSLPQLKLFDFGEVLGDEGWRKFLKLDEYATRRLHRPHKLQQVLFPYSEAM